VRPVGSARQISTSMRRAAELPALVMLPWRRLGPDESRAASATAMSMLSLCTSKPTYRVLDCSMVRPLANSLRPDRPSVRCVGVARHAPGAQPTLLQGTDRPKSRSHLV